MRWYHRASTAGLGLAILSVSSIRAQVPIDNYVIRWDNAALQAIRTLKPGPPMNARSLAMLHTAIFDAWTAYEGNATGTRLGGSLRRPTEERTLENKNKAISYAAYDVL